MSALFNKKKKDEVKEEKAKKDLDVTVSEGAETPAEESGSFGSSAFSGTGGDAAHRILSSFYVSEKASLGNSFSQYVFRVFKNANKSEIKKEVSRLFNVKVKNVKILNMPEKRRDFGKHPGSRSGFKKAVVVLEEGQTIGQAKP